MRAGSTGKDRGQRDRFAAHWTIFLPSLVVACLYGGLWLVLAAFGRADMALARLLLIVFVVGVPLLLVHAALRHRSCRLVIGDSRLWCRHGWFRPRWRRIALADVDTVSAARSLFGRLLGGGAVVIRFKDGETLKLDDLDAPLTAARAIRMRLGRAHAP